MLSLAFLVWRELQDRDLSLKKGEGWLHNRNNYYLASTVYKLFAPLVVYRLIQKRLTLVDLTVDPHIRSQYLLAKRLYVSFTDDFELARVDPAIIYDPNAEASPQVEKRNPEKYIRQGIFAGWLDGLVDNLIKAESDGTSRCLTYGEFERVYYQEDNQVEPFSIAAELFLDFHPKKCPVLWRILMVQAHIHEALIRTRDFKLSPSGRASKPLLQRISAPNKSKLEWRSTEDNVTDAEALIQPLEVALKYLHKHLEDLFDANSTTAKNAP